MHQNLKNLARALQSESRTSTIVAVHEGFERAAAAVVCLTM